MNQKQNLFQLLLEYCNMKVSRTFTLAELNEYYQNYDIIGIGGKTPQATVRRLLQELRDDKLISFLDSRGAYTLLGIDVLPNEIVDENDLKILLEIKHPSKKEYTIETYARNRGWVKKAKEVLGLDCLYPNCQNTFMKENGSKYIEVHHIIPLHTGGVDGIWNLSVVCAHHHKMAHFADMKTRKNIEVLLLKETELRI